MFIKIPPNFLKEIYSNCERIPSLYFHSNQIARDFFWMRLKKAHDLILENVLFRGRCLDFGCGNGVFIPSLTSIFNEVTAVDIETREIEKVVDYFNLKDKVKIINIDLSQTMLQEKGFDLVVALDVLEHFKDPEIAVRQIKECLATEGFLMTSLPTENIFTQLTRKISGTQKPFDHYHTGKVVEKLLERRGFKKVKSSILSWYFPLYYLTLWRII